MTMTRRPLLKGLAAAAVAPYVITLARAQSGKELRIYSIASKKSNYI